MLKQRLSGIRESLSKVNAYIVHMAGNYRKTFQRVELDRIEDPRSFADMARRVEQQKAKENKANNFRKLNTKNQEMSI